MPEPTASVRVSVCMATYNGERYVREQVTSILAQLEPDDELVIVDDASTDDTVSVIAAIGDPRIIIERQTGNRGYVRTFEHALTLATGDVLLLADQDDVWIDGHRNLLTGALAQHHVAASNLVLLDSGQPLRSPLTRRPWLLHASSSGHTLRNQWRILLGDAPYFGCTMALRRDALPSVLPFPEWLNESHDLWIATVANTAKQLIHVSKPTVRRRVHDSNASSAKPRGLRKAILSRVLLLRMWREARKRSRTRTPRRPADPQWHCARTE